MYGRGVLDNKWQVAANMETMLLLKRRGIPLDRDVIFVAEAGEEAATGPGIEYLVNERWNEIDAEYCIAEAGEVLRRGGQLRLRDDRDRREAAQRRAPRRAWPVRPRLAAAALERDSPSRPGNREDRIVGIRRCA